MKWLNIILLVAACHLLSSCISIPIPCPGFMVPVENEILYGSSHFRFNGALYVLGGHHEKLVPRLYNACRAGLFCNEAGMIYETQAIINRHVFEITDAEEASIIEKADPNSFTIKPSKWKDLGTISSTQAIRDSQYYMEFKGYIYAVGGAGHEVGRFSAGGTTISKDWIEKYYGDVWRSNDLLKWEQVTKIAPWTMENNYRRNFRLTVYDGAIYIVGGFSTETKGKKYTDYNDVWKSEDGITWHKDEDKKSIWKNP